MIAQLFDPDLDPDELCRPDDWHAMSGGDIAPEDAVVRAQLYGYDRDTVAVRRRAYLEEVAAQRVALRFIAPRIGH